MSDRRRGYSLGVAAHDSPDVYISEHYLPADPGRTLGAFGTDGKPLSIASVRPADTAEVNQVIIEECVHPKSRKQGIGDYLLRWSIDVARELFTGCPADRPHIVHVITEPLTDMAKHPYEKHGFVLRHANYIMRCDLEPFTLRRCFRMVSGSRRGNPRWLASSTILCGRFARRGPVCRSGRWWNGWLGWLLTPKAFVPNFPCWPTMGIFRLALLAEYIHVTVSSSGDDSESGVTSILACTTALIYHHCIDERTTNRATSQRDRQGR